MPKPLTLLLLLLFVGPSYAQDDYDAEQRAEIARQQQFRAGFEQIVADLNDGSLTRFTRSIDYQLMLENIYGLRLIDLRVKRSFSENFEQEIPNIVESMFPGYEENGITATLLSFESREFYGRALVRYDLPDFQFNYHEYDLRMDETGRIVIADWIDFVRGEAFAQGVGESLVAAAPSKQAVRKLIDLPRITDSQVFQMTELLKATRDRNHVRYLEIFNGLDDGLKKQRVTVLSHVQLMKAVRKRRNLRTALIEMAKYFPEEPLYSLALLDYYFPSRRFEEALQALLRLQQRLGAEDSAMLARLSAASLVNRNSGDALSYAQRAIEMEPSLELGWWSLLRAAVVEQRYEEAVSALSQLEQQFGHKLDPDAFQKDRLFAAMVQSPEYKDWLESRK